MAWLLEICTVLTVAIFAILGAFLVFGVAINIFVRPWAMAATAALGLFAAWQVFHATGPFLLAALVFSVIAVGASFSEWARTQEKASARTADSNGAEALYPPAHPGMWEPFR